MTTRDQLIEAGATALYAWTVGSPARFDDLVLTSQDYWRAEAAAVLDAVLPLITPGDEHHTMDELYRYRMLYNAHAVNEWARHGTYPVVKSRRHSDGEPCFGGGWFIVAATLPTGQASNHYQDEFWDLFHVPEVDLPPEYDGHTPEGAADRLRAALITPADALNGPQGSETPAPGPSGPPNRNEAL